MLINRTNYNARYINIKLFLSFLRAVQHNYQLLCIIQLIDQYREDEGQENSMEGREGGK